MKVVPGDLFDVTEGIIAHQVNCQGVMGSGVAAVVKRLYPKAFERYAEFCDANSDNRAALLGIVQPVLVADGLKVLNVFGQEGFGSPTRNTSYDATDVAWEKIGRAFGDRTIYIPYLMGCALGGGDFTIYSAIVDSHHPDVVAVKLP